VASLSYPRSDYQGGRVTELMYERLSAVNAPDGLLGSPADAPAVFSNATGARTVRLRANVRALLRGFAYDSGDTEIPLVLEENTSGASRVDLIVLRLTRATWTVQETVITGTPGQGPPAAVRNLGATGVYDLPLAEVAVANGAGELAGSTITPRAWYLGEDGQILCRNASRPPHAPGRRIRDIEDNATYESTGTSWLPLLSDTGHRIDQRAISGWSLTRRYLRMHNGVVMHQAGVRRTLHNLSAGSIAKIVQLPEGMRPEVEFQAPVFVTRGLSGDYTTAATYTPDGYVSVNLRDGIRTDSVVVVSPATFVPA